MTPVQEGGAAGSAAPRSKFDLAEEAASTSREVAEDALSANTLQAVYFAEADEEEATRQAVRVPQQPATSDPAGGSLWDDL